MASRSRKTHLVKWKSFIETPLNKRCVADQRVQHKRKDALNACGLGVRCCPKWGRGWSFATTLTQELLLQSCRCRTVKLKKEQRLKHLIYQSICVPTFNYSYKPWVVTSRIRKVAEMNQNISKMSGRSSNPTWNEWFYRLNLEHRYLAASDIPDPLSPSTPACSVGSADLMLLTDSRCSVETEGSREH